MKKVKEEIIARLKQGMSFSQIAREVGCSKSTISFHANRIGIIRPSNALGRKRYNWEEVQRYHDAGHGTLECMKYFGLTSNSWTKAIRRGAIQPNGRAIIPLEDILVDGNGILANGARINRFHLKNRLIREGLLENKCAICGLTEWMGKPLALELDHINGKRNDHRLENLRILCPNCHSQTDTYCGKNRKSRRNQLFRQEDTAEA